MGYISENGKVQYHHWNKHIPTVEMQEVDVPSLTEFTESEWAKDAHHVYFRGAKVEGLDAASFQVLPDGYMWDKNNAWYKTERLANVQVANFRSLGKGYATDGITVFWGKEAIAEVHPESFIVTDHDRGIAHTKDGLKVRVQRAETKSLEKPPLIDPSDPNLSDADRQLMHCGEANSTPLAEQDFLFPYYPLAPELLADELESKQCVLCENTRACLDFNTYKDDIRYFFCLECIAQGKAKPLLQKADTSFNHFSDTSEQIRYCMPGISTWQDHDWPHHCDDPCAFLTYAGKKEYNLLAADSHGERLCEEITESWHDEVWDALADDRKALAHASAYIFKCRHCSTLKAFWDMS